MTTDDADLARAVAYVETAMQPYLRSASPPVDLALALMAGAASVLVPLWGAERALAALDALIEAAAEGSVRAARH